MKMSDQSGKRNKEVKGTAPQSRLDGMEFIPRKAFPAAVT